MKKLLLWFLLFSFILCCLSGCRDGSPMASKIPAEGISDSNSTSQKIPIEVPEKVFQVAMLSDYQDITDQGFNQVTYESARDWCIANHIPYTYYKAKIDTTESRMTVIEQAIDDGANVLLLPGFTFAKAIVETAEKYPEVYYIALDVGKFDLQDAAGCADDLSYVYPKNVFSAVYQDEIGDFLAGYAAVKLGYRHLAFFGGIAVPGIMQYGYGFVQGADYAAAELNVEVSVKYAYGNQCFSHNTPELMVDEWFREGTELVFFCGGGVYEMMTRVERSYDLKIIGFHVDQQPVIDHIYGKNTTVTSAIKNFPATIRMALSKLILEDQWEQLGGKVKTLGLVSGTDLQENHVGLSDSTQWNDSFTREDYAAIVDAIFSGYVTIDPSIEQEPECPHIHVDFLGTYI